MTDDDGAPMGSYATALVEGDGVAGLGPVMAPGTPASWGVYLVTDDVDGALARASDAGGEVLVGPIEVPDQGRIAWVRDPVGAAVGLWQPGPSGGAVRANEHGTNIWNELVTADAERAAPFYDRVLGLESQQMQVGETPYTTLTVAGRPVGGISPPMAEGVPPHWNVCFNVDDCDATVARATELGATLVAPATDMGDIGRIATLADPLGATFSIMQNPSG